MDASSSDGTKVQVRASHTLEWGRKRRWRTRRRPCLHTLLPSWLQCFVQSSSSESSVLTVRAFWLLPPSLLHSRLRWNRCSHAFPTFTKLSRNLGIQPDPVIYASDRVTFRAKSAFPPHACIFVYNVKQILNNCSN